MASWEVAVGCGVWDKEVLVCLQIDCGGGSSANEEGHGSVVGEVVGAGDWDTDGLVDGGTSWELQEGVEGGKYTETVSLISLVLTPSPLVVPGLRDGFVPEGGGVVGGFLGVVRETG